jgi:hypothetical protein
MLGRWQQQQLLLLSVVLAWSLHAAPTAGLPFRVYEPCSADVGGVGLCRKEPSSINIGRRGGAIPATVTKPVPKQLPVDMRFPCTDADSCKKVGSYLSACSDAVKVYHLLHIRVRIMVYKL